jgi:hypothetical protein
MAEAGMTLSRAFYILFTTSTQPGNKLPGSRCEGGRGFDFGSMASQYSTNDKKESDVQI